MAVELAQAYVSITPSARGIGRSLAREIGGPIDTAAANAGRSASRRFAVPFTDGLRTAGRRAGLALTAGLGVAGFFAVKTAANFEQTRIAFEGILGDVEQANDLLRDLRDFAAVTPFEFTELTKSAQQLLAVGFAAEDIIPTMTRLGNVAATLGVGPDAIEHVVRALGQIRGKGKAAAQELIQISEAVPGFSAISVIAEQMGVTTAEAFKLVEQGAVPAQQAIDLILQGMEDFPGAAGAMERQSKTLNGVISTFKDTLATTAIDFITPYLPALSEGVRQVGEFTQSLSAKLQEFIASEGFQAFKEDVVAVFQDIADIGGGVFEVAGIAIEKILLPAITKFVDWLADNEAVMVGALGAMTAAMVAYAAAATAAAIANVIAFAPFFALIGLLAAAAVVYYLLADRGDGFLDVLIRTWGAIMIVKDAYSDFFRTIWRWANRAWEAVSNLLDAINDLLEKAPGDGGLFDAFNLLVPGFGSGLGILGEFDDGGVVPGRRGVPGLILAHGGETVFPTHKAPMPLLSSSALVGGDLVVQQLPGEDAGEATIRGLRKVRLLAGA